ncbi:hypothetical protein NHX12_019392 [Muraenolepis orangiensis]|uniref:MOSC domain-containing protein n=1 Tax=Muraenolepis orangiensis TaxID=630683 RepID=A0A9Q0ETK1_9TELE|nr:hypothetical protein NHX12_019392 [Muraenolepis orangiensis]
MVVKHGRHVSLEPGGRRQWERFTFQGNKGDLFSLHFDREKLLFALARRRSPADVFLCMSTTIDPDTGVINRKEPLETLKGYRQCKPSERSIYKAAPLFGQLFLVKKTGKLQVGDVVYKISH